MRRLHRTLLAALALVALASNARAADVTLTLGAGNGLSVKNNTGAVERLRVDEATGNLSRNGALFVHTTGANNTFVGFGAGNLATTGTGLNSAFGKGALELNTTGYTNSAFGSRALARNTTGSGNSAFGEGSLIENDVGIENSAFGLSALNSNRNGLRNDAFGALALALNVSGSRNSAFGSQALRDNQTGSYNAAFGTYALHLNTTGFENSAFGEGALIVSSASNNTALGTTALAAATTGSGNVAVGRRAGFNQTSGSNNIYLANLGVAGENGQVKIGTVGTHTQATIAGIHGNTSAGGIGVVVNASGTLGTTTSSGRFKQDVQDMAASSDLLMQLRPVTFHYKKEVAPDTSDERQYGLIAEEVAEVAPELVAPDLEGRPYSVKYHVLPALLLNQAQRDHRMIEALEKRIEGLEREIAARGPKSQQEGGR